MKRTRFFLFFISCMTFVGSAAAQYMDDTTFLGSWKLSDLGDAENNPLYSRAQTPGPDRIAFTITPDGKLLRRKESATGETIDLEGTWWSLSMGHFDITYYDPSLGKEVIERFDYVPGHQDSLILLVGYEETVRPEDSRFADTYWKELSADGDGVVYVQCEKLEEGVNGFYLSADSGSLRRLQLKAKKQRFGDLEGVWWNTENPDYFDMQYYSTAVRCIVIEGFEVMLTTEGKPIQILRTRYEELREN